MRPDRPRFPAKIPSSVQPVSQSDAALARRRASVPAIPSGVGLDSMAVRTRMVQRLAVGLAWPEAVLHAMGRVDRHRFVDSALANQAYEDTSLPIGLGQTISKPSVVARMSELLLGAACARTDGLGRVLEIGTGCGYQAVVLSLLAREVYSMERLRGLHEKARDNLRPLRLTNVGGRLVAPISGSDGQQMLLVVDKTSHGLKQSILEPVHFVPLKSGIA